MTAIINSEDILVRVGSFIDINPKDVLFFEADMNYTQVYMRSGEKFLVSTTLKIIQNRLDENFFRSHRSYLINLNCVKKVLNQKYLVKLANNVQLKVSRRKQLGLLEAIKKTSKL